MKHIHETPQRYSMTFTKVNSLLLPFVLYTNHNIYIHTHEIPQRYKMTFTKDDSILLPFFLYTNHNIYTKHHKDIIWLLQNLIHYCCYFSYRWITTNLANIYIKNILKIFMSDLIIPSQNHNIYTKHHKNLIWILQNLIHYCCHFSYTPITTNLANVYIKKRFENFRIWFNNLIPKPCDECEENKKL